MNGKVWGLRLFGVAVLFGVSCGGSSQSSNTFSDGSRSSADPEAGAQPSDGGASNPVDSSTAACNLPAAPGDLCGALSTGKVTPCSTDSSGQPSQTGYLEIDGPGGAAPMYVCATSWSPDPTKGYIFGQPATFLSQSQGCCGGTVSPTAVPTVPQSSIGTLGTPRIPDHLKPQEMEQTGSGPIRQNPFAIAVTDTKSGAAATAAISTWLSWQGDGMAHPAPDGTGAYHFMTGAPINYVILETSDGVPILVIGPEVSLAADGSTPIGHPSLGVCSAGGGAALAVAAGEVHGTTINNHSGRYDYGPSETAQALDTAAKLFNCMGIQITGTTFTAPKTTSP
ncbi:MAG TPA: hypothetical protein VKZ18_06700 [Polyangia bacterium]|nr:hypothetical protein [Polyangia bacterium]